MDSSISSTAADRGFSQKSLILTNSVDPDETAHYAKVSVLVCRN